MPRTPHMVWSCDRGFRRDGALPFGPGLHHRCGLLETYVERVLAPSLPSGQLVVMDNLVAHKGQRIKELIEE
jgi:hypothetical protein